MKKKIISLAVCVVMLVLLGAVYLVVSRNNTADEVDEETSTTYTLVDKDRANLTKVTLVSSDYDITLLRDENDVWTSGDYDFPLDQTFVSTLLGYVASLTTSFLAVENAEDMSLYGLSPAALTVKGYYADGSESTILVGNEAPGKEYYYVTVPGDTNVYMVTTYIGGVLSRNYTDLINKVKPDIDLLNLRYMYFDNGKTPLEANYVKNTDEGVMFLASEMIMESPIEGSPVYLDNFNNYVVEPLAEIYFNDVHELFSSGDEKYGLDDPKLTLIIEGVYVDGEGNETGDYRFYMAIGDDADENGEYVYAKYGDYPSVFKVKSESIAPLYTVNTYKMIDRFINMIYISDVEKITVTTTDAKYEMVLNNYKSYKDESDEEGTDEIAPTINSISVKDSVFRKLYTMLIGLNVDTVIEDYTTSGEPVITISFKLNNGEPDRTTNFYDYNADFYAVEQQGSANFVINKNALSRLVRNIDNLMAGIEVVE